MSPKHNLEDHIGSNASFKVINLSLKTLNIIIYFE